MLISLLSMITKSDYRTFRNIHAEQYNVYRWTRIENQILVHPPLETGQVFELYYYRRLPALNAQFNVNPTNFAANLLTSVATVTPPAVQTGTGLFFQRFANPTAFSMEASDTNANAIRFNLTFDQAFTAAEQATLIASSTTAGSARDDYVLVLSEQDIDIFAATDIGTNRVLFIHISQDIGDNFGIPVFSNNGQTISWTLYTGGSASLGTTRENIINNFRGWHPRVFTGAQVATITGGYLGGLSATTILANNAFNADGSLVTGEDAWTTRSLSEGGGGSSGNTRERLDMADNFQTLIGELAHAPVPGQDTAFATDPGNHREIFFEGNEAAHWLRDEQEKILLWGALVHIFDYLGETEMMQKYTQKFQFEIQELNNEEGKRRVTGGNTQINFDGFLI